MLQRRPLHRIFALWIVASLLLAQLSVRTVLEGTVETIEADGPSASVTLVLKGDGRLVASLTRKSADELSLAAGKNVFALVKSVALDA